jgi:uncharacterized protein (DUF2249 family)
MTGVMASTGSSVIVSHPMDSNTLPGSNAPSIDLRSMPRNCDLRKARVGGAFALLLPGESLAVVSDHRPKGLRAHFDETLAGRFAWEEVESGPEVFRVVIRRLETT